MTQIFREFAPLYWAAGLPVIPLKKRDKRPILNEWQTYGENMPSDAIQKHWLSTHPESNIGLPFGPASGLCAIDVDTLDAEQIKAIESVLPQSPWIRVGKKGYGAVFKWEGQRNFKIRDDQNQSIVEFLGLGNQLVLPPSIHPDTGKAYVSNTNLWEVVSGIPPLGSDIEERLRSALGVAGFSLSHEGRSKPLEVVPEGQRDIQLVRHAGYLARVVLGIDKAQQFSLGEAIHQMYHWVEAYTSKVAGDAMDPDKGVSKLLEFLLKDVEGGRTMPDGWDNDLTDDQRDHPTIKLIAEKNQAERWTLEKARDWIAEQTSKNPTDQDWCFNKIVELVDKVSRDEQFGEFHFAALIPVLQQSTSLKLSKPDLKKMFKEARASDEEAAQDHEAIAKQVLAELDRGGEVRFDKGSFWQWGGAHFSKVPHDDVTKLVGSLVKNNPLAKRTSDYTQITKLVAMIASRPLEESEERGVNFANGFLDISGELHPHNPRFGATFTMPFNYIPARAGEAHKWMTYLERAWGEEPDYVDRVKALQEAFAATMFGIAARYQRAFLLHGRPKTGKTTALEVLRALMPSDATAALPPDLWGQRFSLVQLIGAALNSCGELPEASLIGGDIFKKVIEGGEVSCEFKGRDIFTFRPISAHWFASNHLPRTRDTSPGFTRRWLVFDFNKIVTAEERMPNFHEILVAEEREAIAAWAVEGLKRLLEQREYTLPASHKAREDQILRSNNSVFAFIESSEKVAKEGQTDVRELFDVYLFYQKEVSRGGGVSFESFRHMLGDLGFHVEEYRDPMRVMRFKVEGISLKAMGDAA
jgi:putative DNA primase/helicase